MGAVVYWEFMDGSCGERHFGGDYDGAKKFAHEEFIGQSVRVWFGGEMVQQGYVAADDRDWGHINPRLLRKIVTTHVNPPIPARDCDWMATFQGYEPGDSIGYGKTEQEAINCLIANEAALIADTEQA